MAIMSRNSTSNLAKIKVTVARITVPTFILFALDQTYTHFLSVYITILRLPMILLFIYAPTTASFRMSKIQEFLIPFYTAVVVFLSSTFAFVAIYPLSMSEDKFYESIWGSITLGLLLTVIAPWLWFGWRISTKKVQHYLLFPAVFLIPIISILFQFNKGTNTILPTLQIGLIGMSVLMLLILAKMELLHPSKRNLRGRNLLICSFIIVGLCAGTSLFISTTGSYQILRLGLKLWLLVLWLTIFFNSDAFIMTKKQTVEIVKGYNLFKQHEIDECVVFDNIDTYLRYLPEELIYQVDNDDLTLLWIGLQRNN